ncbi:hypothetical protein [Paraburkholderia guartelaensis]|uniref:Head-tail adaptor protein n=1 Tax=Paraburkholderia guartelaensis TaxID=2546446 RepID=A0ABU9SFV2_9BURK
MFDPGIFWDAFAAVGMLKTAYVDGMPGSVQVGFVAPDHLELGNQTTAAEYQIEYQAHDLPDLARGSLLSIDDVRYRVLRPPRRQHDGFFMVADLGIAK